MKQALKIDETDFRISTASTTTSNLATENPTISVQTSGATVLFHPQTKLAPPQWDAALRARLVRRHVKLAQAWDSPFKLEK